MLKKLLFIILLYSSCFYRNFQIFSMADETDVISKDTYNIVCPVDNCNQALFANRRIDWAKKFIRHLKSQHRNNTQYKYKNHNDFLKDLIEKDDSHLYFNNQRVTNNPKNIMAKCAICGLNTYGLYRSESEALRVLNVHYHRCHKNFERTIKYFLQNRDSCLQIVNPIKPNLPEINPDLLEDDFELPEISDFPLFDYGDLGLVEDFQTNNETLPESRNYKIKCPDLTCNYEFENFRLSVFINAVLRHWFKHEDNDLLNKYKNYRDLKRTIIEQGDDVYMAGILILKAPKNILPKCCVPLCRYKPKLFRNEKEAFFVLKMHYKNFHKNIDFQALLKDNKKQFIEYMNLENNPTKKRVAEYDLFSENSKIQKLEEVFYEET